MDNNQNIQPSFAEASAERKPKSDRKGFAIASFVLGIVNSINILAIFYFGPFKFSLLDWAYQLAGPRNDFIRYFLPFLIFPFIFVFGVPGFILGIIGLKCSKRIFVKIGIILNVICILLAFFFTWWFVELSKYI